MIERIESKINEIIEAVLAKPTSEFTKSDFDILSAEWGRLKMEIENKEHSKRMAEMVASIWDK